ncbi:MerR family transcriptional regulator [bacterium]|nr:MAG: MerR family transcriptional regulator [bacterium]
MRGHTIGEVAKLARISIKTLHHFDKIGLLKPSQRDESGYRRYSREDLLKLQSVLFYRELKFPLKEIKKLLDAPDVNLLGHLQHHKKLLEAEQNRMKTLLNTLTKTIQHLENTMPITEEELYEGFSKEEIEAINKEVDTKYDPKIVAESRKRVQQMNKNQWNDVKLLADDINQKLAALISFPIDAPEVQEQIVRHHEWVNTFYDCSLEMYAGLSDLYVQDERFKANYDSVKPGLAEFLSKAMKKYVEKGT